ncbi:MAG TPA: hypothetical protein ENK12_09935 [Gammaproteobacteria bacterium]|nr:hypothetical protein [Gammaproteobacteria bacterium]
MSHPRLLRRIAGLILPALLLLPLAATAAEEEEALPFSDLELVIPERHFSEELECVQPEDEMRRNHMKYILHQRDETMHKGIRTRRYSLEECINCHAVKDDNGEYVRIEDSRHFCATCHTYAAVDIDCFQCHADVPVRESMLHTLTSSQVHHGGTAPANGLSSDTLRLLAAEDAPQ